MRKNPKHILNTDINAMREQLSPQKLHMSPKAKIKMGLKKEEIRKLKEISQLVREMDEKLLHIKEKSERAIQTDSVPYRSKKPSTLTVYSILKETAINELFGLKPQIFKTLLDKADSELKQHLLASIVNQYKYQIVIEEILIELRDQGLDVEACILEVYNRMGLKITQPQPSSDRLIIDTETSDAIPEMKLNLKNLN